MLEQSLSWEEFNKCKICQLQNPEAAHYWKEHKIKRKDYFEKYFPKKDLFSRQKIEFKSLENYYCDDFVNRDNLRKYLEPLTSEDKKRYIQSIFIKRFACKNKNFLPTNIELRSIIAPSIKYLDNLFKKEGGYYQMGSELGIESRIKQAPEAIIWKSISKEDTLIIDTREQNNLKFYDIARELAKLEYGDYALKDKTKVVVERKSLMDFIGSFGKDYDRLKREFGRAKQDGGQIYILVEEELSKALVFNTLQYINKFVKATPEFIFHNVRDAIQSFDNIQFLFVGGRGQMEGMICFLLSNHDKIKTLDLQLLYDTNRLPSFK